MNINFRISLKKKKTKTTRNIILNLNRTSRNRFESSLR